jgi:hypothetical protein
MSTMLRPPGRAAAPNTRGNGGSEGAANTIRIYPWRTSVKQTLTSAVTGGYRKFTCINGASRHARLSRARG